MRRRVSGKKKYLKIYFHPFKKGNYYSIEVKLLTKKILPIGRIL